jgi:predicted alpha-1,2-mannosidase
MTTGTGASSASAVPVDLAFWVNVFTGTQDNLAYDSTESAFGDTTPGATTPFGMVNFNPNTTGTSRDQGGYHYNDSTLRGFALDRLSGTGCTGNNGAEDFPIFPYNGDLPGGVLPSDPTSAFSAGDTNINDKVAGPISQYYETFDHADESAQPGYYTVQTGDGIKTELSATTRTGDGRFTFPDGMPSNTLIFDVSGSINPASGSSVELVGNDVVEGTTRVQALCSQGVYYTVHFYAKFATPFTSAGTWLGTTMTPETNLTTSSDSSADDSQLTGHTRDDVGAWISFAQPGPVDVSIGLSYVSVANAQANQQAEATGRGFDAIKSAAHQRWDSSLGAVRVTGGTPAQLTTFYTALYHTMVHPNIAEDVNGQYAGYDGQVHTARAGHNEYQTFSGWDIYRHEAQLIALLFPDRASDINQSIDDMANQGGVWNLPHASAGQNRGPGDSLESVLASMDDFGATDYDRADALKQIVAAQTLLANASPDGTQGVPNANKRGGAFQYIGLGFDTGPNNGSSTGVPAASTLEYATDDFGIAQLALRLGDAADYQTFMQRAHSWQNLFDPGSDGINSRGKTGFVRGSSRANTSSANNQYFSQGSDYQYGWNASSDIARLVAMKGGPPQAEAQLDQFFSNFDPESPNHVVPPTAGQTVDPGHNSQFAYMTNEIDSQVPEVYNWLGRPDRTAEVNQEIRDTLWTDNGTDGLLGNDDLGATSAWYVWSSIGLFPAVYGTSDLVVSGTAFRSISITSTGKPGRTYTITAPSYSAVNKYVTGMKVNGATSGKNWLPESFAQRGGTVFFTMASRPGDWGSGTSDVPPSFGDGSDAFNNIGITTGGNGGQGSFDASDNTFQAELLPAPGATLTLPGHPDVTYTWPNVPAATPDNWIPHGQVVDLGGQRLSSISFLGAATNGPARGMASVNYTDGTTQVVPVQLDDWTTPTLPAGTDVAVANTAHRNARNGSQDNTAAMVWGTAPEALDGWKKVASVTLPDSSDTGIMHIFAVGGAPASPVPLSVTATASDTVSTTLSGTVAQFSGGAGAAARDYTATVSWGDNSQPTRGTVLAAGDTQDYEVFAQHQYGRPGTFRITVSIDDGTTAKTDTSTVVVQRS